MTVLNSYNSELDPLAVDRCAFPRWLHDDTVFKRHKTTP